MNRLPRTVRVLVALAGTAIATGILLQGKSGSVAESVTQGNAAQGNAAANVAAATGTFTGPVIDTQWGPVQVKITLSGGSLSNVEAVQTPDAHRKSVSINQRATPVLRQEALKAQSADIDTVSGATITSEGYRESLQAALDAAKG